MRYCALGIGGIGANGSIALSLIERGSPANWQAAFDLFEVITMGTDVFAPPKVSSYGSEALERLPSGRRILASPGSFHHEPQHEEIQQPTNEHRSQVFFACEQQLGEQGEGLILLANRNTNRSLRSCWRKDNAILFASMLRLG